MERSSIVTAARSRGAVQVYFPVPTMKCNGPRLYRSQTARDLACILDVNPSVASWICMPRALDAEGGQHMPDFEVVNVDGRRWLADAPDRGDSVNVDVVTRAAAAAGAGYRLVHSDDVYSGPRLRNAKDLLRYGDHTPSLGDRIRLLAVLEEESCLTVAEALRLFQESKPMVGLAAMILQEMVEIDLDDALIGPGTMVRRIRR
jgi:hypothetical protein